MRTVRAALAAILLSSTVTASADAPKAADILKRSMARYDAAKTYQGILQVTIKGPGMDTTITIDVKSQNGGKASPSRSLAKMTSETTDAAGRHKQAQIMVDDGKTVYVVSPNEKRYAVQPHHSDRLSKLFERSLTNLSQVGGELAVSVRDVQGRPTYALTGTHNGASVLILVDKATFEMKALNMTRGPQTSKMSVTQQVFNAPIPASTFVWTPPKDYQKMGAGPGK